MKVKLVFEYDEDCGFAVWIPTLPGCITQGNTKEEELLLI